MRAPGWRVAVAVASTVSMGGLAGFGAPATAGYPEACFPGVSGVGQRGMVAVERQAEPAFLAAVARLGGRAAARIEPLGARAVEFPSPQARDASLAALRRVPGVRWAEPELEVRFHRVATDPYYRHQWALPKIGAPRAWDVETGVGKDVTIAVLDTGVDLRHPDLRGKTTSGKDVVNGDEDAQDDEGHGTHVAGTAAATANNRVGIAGVSWGAKVLAIKVLDENGSGTSCDVAVGMLDAVEREADVMNMSLGAQTDACPLVFRAATELAIQRGTLPVASSGNDGLVGAPNSSPANCPGVLGVGATDPKDKAAIFSSFGPNVDVSAPGDGILSTIYTEDGSAYAEASGTSMAAPHVSGLAALLKAAHPDWTPAQIADRIVKTADDLGPRGRDDFYGSGRINAARALGR